MVKEKEESKEDPRIQTPANINIEGKGKEMGKPQSLLKGDKEPKPCDICFLCGKKEKQMHHIKCTHGDYLCELCYS